MQIFQAFVYNKFAFFSKQWQDRTKNVFAVYIVLPQKYTVIGLEVTSYDYYSVPWFRKYNQKTDFQIRKTYNDYGLGFYCTDILEMAKEWGVCRDRNGYANRYTLDCDGLQRFRPFIPLITKWTSDSWLTK